MNILLVDDEVLSVESIASSIDWQSLGIWEVYKAFSMQHAQEILGKYQVDIIVCDIEMPKGTGIQLIEWMRAMQYEAVCIFLTCYSRFEYASTAIRLRIFDYVLKPCEYNVLEDVIRRAAERVRKSAADRMKQLHGEYWYEDYDRIITNFWEQVIKGAIEVGETALARQLLLHHLDKDLASRKYYILLLKAVPDKEMDGWDNNLLSYAVRNIVLEMLDTRILYVEQDNRYTVVKDAEGIDQSAFGVICESIVKTLSTTLPSAFFGYFDEPCGIAQAAETYLRLHQDMRNCYSLKSMVFRHEVQYQRYSLPQIDNEQWQNALLSQNTDLILEQIRNLLSTSGGIHIIDRNLLRGLYHQLLSTIHSVLDLHNLPIHQPFLNENTPIYENVFNSILDFELWAEDVLENTISLLSTHEESSSILNNLRQYIRDNLDSDLSRTQIANQVHLNPDYLSTLFRKKSGYSLSQFVTTERIAASKKLLLSTDLPINEIAIRTGFQNISYFSKQFKRLENQTPLSYRNNKGRISN